MENKFIWYGLNKQFNDIVHSHAMTTTDLLNGNYPSWMALTNREEYGNCKFIAECFFTGIKDKNGKEIYEGDILKFENDLGRKHIYKIWMEEGGLVYNMFDNDIDKHINQIDFYYGCSDMQSKQWLKQCEVIGNIYENPQLLSRQPLSCNGRQYETVAL